MWPGFPAIYPAMTWAAHYGRLRWRARPGR
jgi:hypothetical protein